jgi:predicted DNA-binding protein
MSQITIYLNDKTLQSLKNISNDSGKAISKISAELIVNGINSYQEDQNNTSVEKMPKHEKNHLVSTTVALNLIFEAFKKLNKEPSKYDGKNAEYVVREAQKAALEKLKDL